MNAAHILVIVVLFSLGGCISATDSVSPAPKLGPVQYVVSAKDAPHHSILGGKASAQLFINHQTGASEAAVTRLRLQPGASVPDHRHAESAEMLFVLTGRVEMVIEGQAVVAEAGDAIYIPAGATHSAKVPDDGAAVDAVQIYAAPGPEARFRKGPKIEQ